MRSIQAVTLGPLIFPRKRAIHWKGILKELLLSFCIHQSWNSLINSLDLFLSPSYMAGPVPLRAPSDAGSVETIGLGWLFNPGGRVLCGVVNTFACANCEKDSVGFTLGIPKLSSAALNCRYVGQLEDVIGLCVVGEGFRGK